MKVLIALTLAFGFSTAHAEEEIMNLAACAAVTPIAVLAKDNMPYWSESQDLAEKSACYNALKAIAQDATVDQIAELEEAFDGQVRILTNDIEFADFVKANKTVSASSPEYVVESAVETLTPVYKPKAIFFQNVSF